MLLILTASCARFKTQICEACQLIEKDGDTALEVIKNLSPAELQLKDSEGKTPFYWSVVSGAKEVRNVLVEKISRETLLSEPAHLTLIQDCAGMPSCQPINLSVLFAMGFRVGAQSVKNAIVSAGECSLPKMDLLLGMKASVRSRAADGSNLLHAIVTRGAEGRPMAPRACLVKAITRLKRYAPALMKERNRAGQTPLQFAQALANTPERWGTNITKSSIEVLVKALR